MSEGGGKPRLYIAVLSDACLFRVFAAPSLPEGEEAAGAMDGGEHHEGDDGGIVVVDAAVEKWIVPQQVDRETG